MNMLRPGVVLLLLAAVPAAATPLEDRLREQLTSTVTQLRELQNGKAALEAAKLAAEKERDAAKARAPAGATPAAARELAAARSQNAALSARAGAAAADLAAANARAAETTARLTAAQTELAQLRATAAASTAAAAEGATALTACTDRNARLVTAGRDLMALHVKRYGRRNFKPLQILRTRIEAEAQAAGDRIAADAIIPNAVPGARK